MGDQVLVVPRADLAAAAKPGFGHAAVIVTATFIARNLIEAAHQNGVRTPEGLSLIGHDDAGVGEETSPRYTSMRHLSEPMGRTAAEKLLEIVAGSVKGPVRVMMPAELVIRESCALPRGN